MGAERSPTACSLRCVMTACSLRCTAVRARRPARRPQDGKGPEPSCGSRTGDSRLPCGSRKRSRHPRLQPGCRGGAPPPGYRGFEAVPLPRGTGCEAVPPPGRFGRLTPNAAHAERGGSRPPRDSRDGGSRLPCGSRKRSRHPRLQPGGWGCAPLPGFGIRGGASP